MKTSSANAKPEPASLQTARGVVGTNLMLPGFGSLMVRRRVGWAQATLTVLGFALTLVFGVRFVVWFFQHVGSVYGDAADPVEVLGSVWREVRWALLGIALFGVAWLWALATNAAILRAARKTATAGPPPVLK
jgi:hypothetical protein